MKNVKAAALGELPLDVVTVIGASVCCIVSPLNSSSVVVTLDVVTVSCGASVWFIESPLKLSSVVLTLEWS